MVIENLTVLFTLQRYKSCHSDTCREHYETPERKTELDTQIP